MVSQWKGLPASGGMPRWKYIANRLLTFTENILLGGQVVGVSYWLSRVCRSFLQKIAPGEKLGRLRLRQSRTPPSPPPPPSHPRADLPRQLPPRALSRPTP